MSGTSRLGMSPPNVAVNAGYVQYDFVPTKAPAYWRQVTVTIPSSLKQPYVHFKIRAFTSIHGNNLYIDDINIGGATPPVYSGIESISSISSVNLFPNPTSGDATLITEMKQAGKVSVKVYDITGKLAISAFDGWLNEGENSIAIDGYSKLSNGVYVVNIIAGESVVQQKLIVQ